jgi:hypothetical protein
MKNSGSPMSFSDKWRDYTTGNLKAAESRYEILEELAPDHIRSFSISDECPAQS